MSFLEELLLFLRSTGGTCGCSLKPFNRDISGIFQNAFDAIAGLNVLEGTVQALRHFTQFFYIERLDRPWLCSALFPVNCQLVPIAGDGVTTGGRFGNFVFFHLSETLVDGLLQASETGFTELHRLQLLGEILGV
ncbi:hypothetical protein D3C78_1584020 [compost metagenome]